MYRHLAAILFLTAFLLQVFQQNLLMLDYAVNAAAFAKNCENKARPVMHCNGKCQLMKKMQEEEKKADQNPGHRAEWKNEIASAQTCFAAVPPELPAGSVVHVTQYTTAYPPGAAFDIFHPPSLG